jgi:Zn-dependent metalloprotease/uncharacterized membrane protein
VKRLSIFASLALAGSVLVALPTLQAVASGPAAPAKPTMVQQMRSDATGTVRVRAEDATGKVGFIRTSANKDLMPGVAGDSASLAAAKADSYLETYGSAFGAAPGQLARTGTSKNANGWTVRYEQRYQGVPVFGSRLLAHIDAAGHLRAVNGFAAPGLKLSTTPRLTAEQAGKAAVAQVRHDPPVDEDGNKADLAGVRAKHTELVIYRTGFTRGVEGTNVLGYAVQVTNDKNVNDMVVMRADSTKVLNRYSMIADDLFRVLFSYPDLGAPEYVEGDALPADADKANLIRSAGESYWLFANAFGRDSYDDDGGAMITLHNRPDSCPNASWNGSYTSYCPGVYSDDVVSHEWGHAYTQYTSGLIYQWQSGALNESYSDVWGETLDLINNREDEGEGDLTIKRPDDQCSTHMRAPILATITAPAAIAGPCAGAAPASFGPQFGATPTVADVVVVTDPADDGDAGDGTTTDGCSELDADQALDDTWAFVDRGSCAFVDKVQNVIDAGYEGIVVGNNRAGDPISIAGNFPDTWGVMVTQADGTKIKSEGEATLSIVEDSPDPRADSYRWLIGEKSTGFGGAIRDMWSPTCAGNPGKVSDVEYYCGFDDGGGVHGNSGVPNHLYALAVDGGTFNGQTLTGIGLDKAAAIWFRAQSQYLTPSSDFPDLADSLLSSCDDLTGQRAVQLSVEEDAVPALTAPITANDCAQLSKAIVATEMSNNAVEMCGYEPLLDPDAPSKCGVGSTTSTVWSEDFEDGLAGWGTDSEVVFTGGIHADWEATDQAPGDHSGGVAFGPAPDQGNCSLGAGDFSSRDSIISPEVTVPATGTAPLLSFDHYVATEVGYDGVSLAYSRNGGAFTAVPSSAYVFNAPTVAALPLDPGNGDSSNPLVGEPAWTGTDEGQNKGTWGQSQVSLTALGSVAGDHLRFRFDAGRDGCGGADGWYVDNVTVTVCTTGSTPTGTPTTTPTTPTPTTTATPTPPAKAATTTSVKKPKNAPAFKEDFKVTVKVAADGAKPTGRVVIKLDGETIGKGKLVDGKVKVTITKNLKVGKHTLVAKYEGSSAALPSKTKFTIKIVES